jgi:membrane protease YdiL (CAAX protease family)
MARRPELDRLLRAADGRVRLGWRLLLFIGLTIAIAALVGTLVPIGLLTGSLSLLVGSVAAGIVVLALDRRPAGALGFYLAGDAWRESVRGLALGAAVAGVVVALMAAAGGLRWTGEAGTAPAWLGGTVGALLFLALPAAAEEALLRGYPLQALSEAWGPWWALALTAVVFGALHRANPGVTVIGTLNVAAAGVFLGVVYLRTASLWWATGAHLGWNWTHGYLADVPVSGLELLDAPLYEGVVRGPAWLGGGSFGPEGSLVATVVLVAASALCWRAGWLRASRTARAARPLALACAAGGEAGATKATSG